ncbi:cell division protein ZapA [Pseudalkalibacillus salsuginis]|uniref:cell division protein ZapA n=1 Tax=Pseudalkalibacillus salsuginis TaxID=2910972 RepID=UPI001F02D8D8|nr:cell division protein ZapA [Pseudalkalibacillus salsuginis]MCF6408717.1 cell division protein ZapA [Pseudalkalibacillus salsuginis]
MSNGNRTIVHIYGQQYTIVGEEDPGHVNRVASIVDKKMREIRHQSNNLDAKQLAVLTSVNITSDYLKLQERVRHLEKQKEE